MNIKKLHYEIEETRKERRLAGLRIIVEDISDEDFRKVDSLVRRYTKTIALSKRERRTIEPDGVSFVKIYRDIPFFVFNPYRGGKILRMEYKDGTSEGYILSVLPKNKSYDLLEEIRSQVETTFSDEAKPVYDELKKLMEELKKPGYVRKLEEELKKAIADEDYERAAKLRDEIARMGFR